jgi:hypothetical protein
MIIHIILTLLERSDRLWLLVYGYYEGGCKMDEWYPESGQGLVYLLD